jgi:hypothetical protein
VDVVALVIVQVNQKPEHAGLKIALIKRLCLRLHPEAILTNEYNHPVHNAL